MFEVNSIAINKNEGLNNQVGVASYLHVDTFRPYLEGRQSRPQKQHQIFEELPPFAGSLNLRALENARPDDLE